MLNQGLFLPVNLSLVSRQIVLAHTLKPSILLRTTFSQQEHNMDQPLYDIFFTGQLVEGTDPEPAKQNLAKIFKTTPEAVAKLFTGKPKALKRGIDKPEALKYKAALHKAGLLVAFKAHQPTPPASPIVDAPENSRTESTTELDWSLAPPGDDLLKAGERREVTARDIDTSNIKMISAFADIEPETTTAPPPPDTSHLSAAAVGEDLLVDKPDDPPPLPLDLEGLSLAPPGTELEELHSDLQPLDPDISALSMAEPGADILAGETKPAPPAAPNTDHMSVAKE